MFFNCCKKSVATSSTQTRGSACDPEVQASSILLAREEVDLFAKSLHDDWLDGIRAKYEKEGKARSTERERPLSNGQTTNINVEWSDLHPEYKKENLEAAYSAFRAYFAHPKDNEINVAARMVHDAWMIRNPKKKHNEHLHFNFYILDHEEQEKDRCHVYRARDRVRELERSGVDTSGFRECLTFSKFSLNQTFGV